MTVLPWLRTAFILIEKEFIEGVWVRWLKKNIWH